MKPDICLYFQVHQPYRLRRFRVFDVGTGKDYFDERRNREILCKVAEKCYRPANQLLLKLVQRSQGHFRVAFSLSGVVLEQLATAAPDVLYSFQELVASGAVELLGETYEHSLASLTNTEEFVAQVERHSLLIQRLFGQRPRIFRNTELIYSDDLAPLIDRMGFKAVLVEGAQRALDWRSPNHVYEAVSLPGLKLLPRNYSLSDDVGFRFSERSWSGWPLKADTFARWIADSPGQSVHLFLDYETFGEHQWKETGIFEFVEHFVAQAARERLAFVHPSTLALRQAQGPLSFPTPTSWADVERDTSAWLGNRLQRAAHKRLYRLRPQIIASGDAQLVQDWRRLSTSDHFYYMCTKWFADGDVHKYFNPYDSPYDAFITFMNVVQDLEGRVEDGVMNGAHPEAHLVG